MPDSWTGPVDADTAERVMDMMDAELWDLIARDLREGMTAQELGYEIKCLIENKLEFIREHAKEDAEADAADYRDEHETLGVGA